DNGIGLQRPPATQEQRFLMPKHTKVTFFTLARSLGRSCWTASWSRCYPPPDGIGLRTFSDHSRAPARQRGAPGLARHDLMGGPPHRLRTLARRPNACRWPASAVHLGWHGRISWEVLRIACARSPGGQTPVVCPPARCTWVGTAQLLGTSSASLAHAGQAAKRLSLAMSLLPDLAVRPGRPWAGTAFSAGFGAQAKTNSTPFDDTLALARGSVAHLRSALTRTFGTDRGDKKGFVTPGGEAGRQGG